MVSMGGPAVAGVTHQACAVKHHDCAREARLTTCCCGDHSDLTSDSSMPPSQKDWLAGQACVTALCLFCAAQMPAVHLGFGLVDNSPPVTPPSDLPVLFADLRL